LKVGFNIALVCVIALICIAAVAITGLAMGHDGTVVALAFTALGAVPASLITWIVRKNHEKHQDTKKGGE